MKFEEMGKQITVPKKVYTEPEDAAKKGRGKKRVLPPDSWVEIQSQRNTTFIGAFE